MGAARSAGAANPSPLRRAHQSLAVLTVAAILLVGAASALANAQPSPLVGLGFGVIATLAVAAVLLAARVTIALERARRRVLPPAPARPVSAPVMTRLVSRTGLLPGRDRD
ncbi:MULTISPECIES: hypothetical protein [Bacteria]